MKNLAKVPYNVGKKTVGAIRKMGVARLRCRLEQTLDLIGSQRTTLFARAEFFVLLFDSQQRMTR